MSEFGLWWFLADVVRVLHVLVVLVIAFAVILAAFGFTRGHRQVALVLWPSVGVYLLWQVLPGCPISDLEVWLRHQVDPSWRLPASLPQYVTQQITGLTLPPNVFAFLALVVGILGAYGFGRFHLAGLVRTLMLWIEGGRWFGGGTVEENLSQRD